MTGKLAEREQTKDETCIRYQLRHPAQAAFAATRPGSMIRTVEAARA